MEEIVALKLSLNFHHFPLFLMTEIISVVVVVVVASVRAIIKSNSPDEFQ